MTKIIGLTGGIGSGKSKVASTFAALGVPCFIADSEAKKLMQSSPELKEKLIALFGAQAYKDSALNSAYIADIVFHNPEKLKALNAIVHPAVGKHFAHWLTLQESPYVIKEVAILFETGSQTFVDKSLLVTAPLEVRIQRVMQRDGCTKEAVLARINNQWKDEQRIPLADYVLENIEWSTTDQQIQALHKSFLSLKD